MEPVAAPSPSARTSPAFFPQHLSAGGRGSAGALLFSAFRGFFVPLHKGTFLKVKTEAFILTLGSVQTLSY